MFNKVLLCLATGLVLTACTMPRPTIKSFTPTAVVVGYQKGMLHEATTLAQQFCSSINKDAQYVRAYL